MHVAVQVQLEHGKLQHGHSLRRQQNRCNLTLDSLSLMMCMVLHKASNPTCDLTVTSGLNYQCTESLQGDIIEYITLAITLDNLVIFTTCVANIAVKSGSLREHLNFVDVRRASYSEAHDTPSKKPNDLLLSTACLCKAYISTA